MMHWLGRLLRWMATMLKRLANVVDPLRPAVMDMPMLARALVRKEWEENSDQSGEMRRHRVYAELVKRFPQDHRKISLAIETALAQEFPR